MTAAADLQRLDAARPRRMLALLGLLPIASICAFVVGMALGARDRDLPLLGLGLLTMMVCSLPLIMDQGRAPSERHVLLSLFCLAFIVRFVVPIFLYYMPATGPIDAPGWAHSNLLPRDLARGQLATLLGLVSILVGYALLPRQLLAGLPKVRRDWSPFATVIVACLMVVLAWWVLLASAFGVIPRTFGSGALGSLALWYIYGNILLTLAVVVQRVRAGLPLLAVTVVLTSLFGLFSGSKGIILAGPAMVVITIIFVKRRIPLRWVLMGVLAMAIVYPAGVFIRAVVLADNTLTVAHSLQRPGELFDRLSSYLSEQTPTDYLLEGLESTTARLDYIGGVSTIVRDTPSRVPFQDGRTLKLFPIAFVPRILWPAKPEITIGQWVTDTYGSGPIIESNTGPSLLGDFFLNYGYLGILAGMLLYGASLRMAHELLMGGKTTVPGLFIAVVIFREVTLNFGGGVAASYAATIFGIVPIIAVHLIVSRLFPGPLPAHEQAGRGHGTWGAEGAVAGRRTSRP